MSLLTPLVTKCGCSWPILLSPIWHGSWLKNGLNPIISPQSCLMQSNWYSPYSSLSILLSISPESNPIVTLWKGSPFCDLILLLSLRITTRNIRWIVSLLLVWNNRGSSIWYIGKVGMTWTRLGSPWPICYMPRRPSLTFMLSILWHLVPSTTWPIQSFSLSSWTVDNPVQSFLQLGWTLSLEIGG